MANRPCSVRCARFLGHMCAACPLSRCLAMVDAEVAPLEAWRVSRRDEAVVLVVGNEARGISPATLAACHERVAISMADGFDSLNASMAAGIALHHVVTQLGGPAALR